MPVTQTIIRQANRPDLERVLQMMEAFYAIDHYPFDRAKSRQNLSALIEQAHFGKLWVVEEGNDLIGYAALTLGFSFEYGGLTAFLDELYVERAYRKRGLGKWMLDWVLTEARNLGVQSVHLEVERHNEAARQLYTSFGFIDQDRFLLTKKLLQASSASKSQ